MDTILKQNDKSTTSCSAKTALVIGGSRGIGAAVCRMLIADHYRVAWTHRGSDASVEGSRKLHNFARETGSETMDAIVDCVNVENTVNFVEKIISEWGEIGNMVYSAGFTSPVPFLDLTAEEWRRIVDINLNGVFIVAHAVIPHMIKAGGGNIVLIGSAAVTSGGGGRADYISAKAGLEGLNLAITKEFAPKGIRCNLVHPSLIETDLLCQRYPDPSDRERLALQVPVRRLGKPEDVAGITCFLLSDKAGYITGQSILVDGGRSYCS